MSIRGVIRPSQGGNARADPATVVRVGHGDHVASAAAARR
jgi:hypothetical protein